MVRLGVMNSTQMFDWGTFNSYVYRPAALQRLLGLVVKVWRNSLCHNVACVFCLCRAYLSECKGNKNMLIRATTCEMGPASKLLSATIKSWNMKQPEGLQSISIVGDA